MDEQRISRKTFEEILRRCLSLLEQKYKFISRVTVVVNDPLSTILEENCFGFFGSVEPKESPPMPDKVDIGLNQRQVDIMVLECALIFSYHGVKMVSYNESLNTIRHTLLKILEAMGFSCSLGFYHAQSDWSSYSLWQEIAQRDGHSAKSVI